MKPRDFVNVLVAASPWFVVAIACVVAVAIARMPIDYLIGHALSDDAFYYFQIARHIVNGSGSTFDGVNPTNGYHPLWMLVLLPIFAVYSDGGVMDTAPIHAVLFVSVVLNGFLGWVLLAIVRHYTSSAAIQALALSAWFLNPNYLFAVVNGLETALSVTLIAAFIWSLLRVSDRPVKSRVFAAGIVGGLMMLARLDNIFYFVMGLVWLTYSGGRRIGVVRCLWMGVPATVIVAPFLAWNYATFGMLFTSASSASTLVNAEFSRGTADPSLAQWLKAAIRVSDVWIHEVATQSGAAPVFVTLAGVMVGRHLYTRRTSYRVSLPVFLFCGFALNFFVNAGVRLSPREWYFIPFGLFLTIGLAWGLERLRADGRLRPLPAVIVVVFVCGLFAMAWKTHVEERRYGGALMLASAHWMNASLPDRSVVGSFNSGITGYFARHRVVNLDGLVNNAAYEALRERDLWRYMQREGITYISDFTFTHRFAPFIGVDIFEHLDEIHQIPPGRLRIYRVRVD